MPYRAWELLPIEEPVGTREKTEYEIEPLPELVEEAPLAHQRAKRTVKSKDLEVAPELPKAPVVRKEAQTFIVEGIKAHRRKAKTLEFLTKYQGFDTPSWQPLRYLKGNPILQAYLAAHPRLQI